MNRTRLVVTGLMVFAVADVSHAQQEAAPTGIIESIRGNAWIHGRHDKQLDAKKDAGRIVYSDESIECKPGAEVTGYSRQGTDKVTLCGLKASQLVASKDTAFESALRLAGRTGGRDKGSESAIYMPCEGGAVSADTFLVRWRTRPPLRKLTAILQDEHGTELARVNDVDGTSGSLDSDALRKALTLYRKKMGGFSPAKLTLQFQSGPEDTVSFSVLSEQQEQALKEALAAQSGEDLMSYLRRAATFDSYHLYNSVAAQYDSALKQVPESLDILRAAINAYSRVGDLHHARELLDKLQQEEDQ